MPRLFVRLASVGVVLTAGIFVCLAAGESGRDSAVRWRQHDIHRPKPAVLEPSDDPAKPPHGAVVLFDGTTLRGWKSATGGPAAWKVKDGVLETVPGAGPIETRAEFGDIQLHVEWAAPSPPRGRSQDRGNSGIFLMGQFEIQVLDSYQAETYADGQAGSIYGQYPPLFNAARPPGTWQTYDIAFRKPRFDSAGKLTEPARITVFHNGILVQNNEAPFGPTSWLRWQPYQDRGGRGPIRLQDHDHPVHFRNIWVLELPDRPRPTAADVAPIHRVSLSPAQLDRYVGAYRMGDIPAAPTAKIARSSDHLEITLPFRPGALELVPTSDTEFAMPYTDGHFTFKRNTEGKVTGVIFRVADGERELKRADP